MGSTAVLVRVLDKLLYYKWQYKRLYAYEILFFFLYHEYSILLLLRARTGRQHRTFIYALVGQVMVYLIPGYIYLPKII